MGGFTSALRRMWSNIGVNERAEWMSHGNCAHESPSKFFPSDGVGVEIARRICATCPQKEPCLEYALSHRIDHGVWGGCSERERRRILRRRRLAAAGVSA